MQEAATPTASSAAGLCRGYLLLDSSQRLSILCLGLAWHAAGSRGCGAAVGPDQHGRAGLGAAHPVVQDRSSSTGAVCVPARPPRPQHLSSALLAAAVCLHSYGLTARARLRDSPALPAANEEGHDANETASPLAVPGPALVTIWPALTALGRSYCRGAAGRPGKADQDPRQVDL